MSGYMDILLVYYNKEVNGVKKGRETVTVFHTHTRTYGKKCT
jgi:hypothetical protein